MLGATRLEDGQYAVVRENLSNLLSTCERNGGMYLAVGIGSLSEDGVYPESGPPRAWSADVDPDLIDRFAIHGVVDCGVCLIRLAELPRRLKNAKVGTEFADRLQRLEADPSSTDLIVALSQTLEREDGERQEGYYGSAYPNASQIEIGKVTGEYGGNPTTVDLRAVFNGDIETGSCG